MNKFERLTMLSGLIIGSFVHVGGTILMWNTHTVMGYILALFTGLFGALQLLDLFYIMTHLDDCFKEDDDTDESNTTVDP